MKHITMKIPREEIKNITAKEWESDGQKLDPGKQGFKEFREIVRIPPRFLTTQKECREGLNRKQNGRHNSKLF